VRIGWVSVRRLCEVGRGWWVSWVCAAAWLGVGACGVGRVLGCCEWVVGVFLGVVYGCEGGLVVVVLVFIGARIDFLCIFEG
jgi:hypothetical protein